MKAFWLDPSPRYNAFPRAEVAQLAERNLAKVEVAGSNPVFRSNDGQNPPPGDVAEWLGAGLQNPLHRFDSGRRLDNRTGP